MKIHLYTLCWNDREMLEFFFRHYEPWVDHFFIWDDDSTDGTREYLRDHPRVKLNALQRTDPKSWVHSARHFYDTCWQASRGVADWVVVTNIDEHLYHPELGEYLDRCRKRGVTAVPALGYQMISYDFPAADRTLWRDVRHGMPWAQMSKLNLFDPLAIERTNYDVGRHVARPEGRVRFPERDELLNLHYKYMGQSYLGARHEMLKTGLRETDVEIGFGHKYSWDAETLAHDFARVRDLRIDVMAPGLDHHGSHREPRWWR